MATRGDARDMANRIRALLELVQRVRPDGFDAAQKREIDRLDVALREALSALRAYVNLRNVMQ